MTRHCHCQHEEAESLLKKRKHNIRSVKYCKLTHENAQGYITKKYLCHHIQSVLFFGELIGVTSCRERS